MARTRGKKNFMVSKVAEVSYEDTDEGKSGGSLFSPYFSELVMDNLLKLKGNGSLTFDVIPFDINKRCGMDVPMPEKSKKYGKGDTMPVDMSGNLRPGSMGWVLNYGYHEIITNHEEWVASDCDFKKKKAVKVVCPRTYGERCPVCDQYEEARFKWPGEKGSQENKDYAKYVLNPMKVKYRTISQLDIHEGTDAEENDLKGERRFWDVSHKDYTGLLKSANKKEKMYYDDSADGFTVSVDFENVGVAGAFPEWSLWDFEGRDSELSDEVMESAIDLSDAEKVFNIKSYDDIMELLEPKVEEKKKDKNEEEEERPTKGEEDDDQPPFNVAPKEEKEDKVVEKPKRTRTRESKEEAAVEEQVEQPSYVNEVTACTTIDALDDLSFKYEVDLFVEDFGQEYMEKAGLELTDENIMSEWKKELTSALIKKLG
jgi:hypothetical protein